MPTLRLAVVGVGHLGKEHARILAGLPGIELVGVVDAHMPQAETVAQRCGTRAYSEHRPLLDLVDAAVVAVPTTYHHAVAGDFLRRGIPVLVEKPLALNLEQADDLVALSRRHGALLQVGHIERFNPAFEALQERPLRPKYVTCERLGIYTGRSTDIGAVLDLMIHDIDLLLAMTGSAVRGVTALGLCVLGGQEDMATARVEFADGCVANLTASRIARAPVRRMGVWGPEGHAQIDFARRHVTLIQPSEALLKRRRPLRPFDSEVAGALKEDLFSKHLEVLELDCNQGDQLTRELQEFVRCVKSGGQPRAGGAEGRAAMALATRVLDSLRNHPWEGHPDGPKGPHELPMPAAPLFHQLGEAA